MATYAIGDLQGCWEPLERLLNHISYHEQNDYLWFCGDLVNRGPDSLQCLRFVKQLVDQHKAVTVLGNHDFLLLRLVYFGGQLKPSDTLQNLLEASDCHELCQWLRQQPLLVYDNQLDYCLVHAGIPPQWTIQQARCYAHEVEENLQGQGYLELLRHLYGNKPDYWQDDLQGMERIRFIINALTRMRFCDQQGKLDFHHKGGIGQQPSYYLPWFQIPWRQSGHQRIVFGHWAALYDHWHEITTTNIFPIDTGCVWGNQLTALRLDDQTYFSVPCK